jgi:hypothetical protein
LRKDCLISDLVHCRRIGMEDDLQRPGAGRISRREKHKQVDELRSTGRSSTSASLQKYLASEGVGDTRHGC